MAISDKEKEYRAESKEEGAELAFRSLGQWLNDPCTEHPLTCVGVIVLAVIPHRKDCLVCWQSLLDAVKP